MQLATVFVLFQSSAGLESNDIMMYASEERSLAFQSKVKSLASKVTRCLVDLLQGGDDMGLAAYQLFELVVTKCDVAKSEDMYSLASQMWDIFSSNRKLKTAASMTLKSVEGLIGVEGLIVLPSKR